MVGLATYILLRGVIKNELLKQRVNWHRERAAATEGYYLDKNCHLARFTVTVTRLAIATEVITCTSCSSDK